MQEFSQRKRGGLHIGKEEAQSSFFPNVDCSHEKLVEPTDIRIRTKKKLQKVSHHKTSIQKFKTFYLSDKKLENRQRKI